MQVCSMATMTSRNRADMNVTGGLMPFIVCEDAPVLVKGG
jgi:hypothetical protein